MLMIKKCWLILFLLVLGTNIYGQEISKDSFIKEIITINYIDASIVVAFFYIDKGQLPENSSLSIDSRTNTIIAYLPSKQMDELRDIVQQLDKPVIKVKLSTYILEVLPSYTPILKEAVKKIEYEQLPLLLAEMEKNGKGKIMSYRIFTGENKEVVRLIAYPLEIPYCECTVTEFEAMVERAEKVIQEGYNFSFKVIPEVVDKEYLTLNIQLGYIADPEKNEAKEKQLIKEATNHQPVFIDELNELLERKDKQIILIITPSIMYPD